MQLGRVSQGVRESWTKGKLLCEGECLEVSLVRLIRVTLKPQGQNQDVQSPDAGIQRVSIDMCLMLLRVVEGKRLFRVHAGGFELPLEEAAHTECVMSVD